MQGSVGTSVRLGAMFLARAACGDGADTRGNGGAPDPLASSCCDLQFFRPNSC
jgi:hypothetical protein